MRKTLTFFYNEGVALDQLFSTEGDSAPHVASGKNQEILILTAGTQRGGGEGIYYWHLVDRD